MNFNHVKNSKAFDRTAHKALFDVSPADDDAYNKWLEGSSLSKNDKKSLLFDPSLEKR